MKSKKVVASAAVGAGLALSPAGAAVAAPGPAYPPTGPTTTQVLGTSLTRSPHTSGSSQLPFTGAPIVDYTIAGVALVVTGAALTRVRRRRRAGAG